MTHNKKRAYYYFFCISIISCLFHGISFGSEFDQIKKIETYLNSIKSFEADILQIDPYGNETSGTIKLKKPGKLRIEYDDPKADHLILASNGVLVVIDYKSNTEPLRYPINETPLKYLSNQNLDLRNQAIDFKIYTSENKVALELKEIERSLSSGRIILYFATDPISITGWEIPINTNQSTKIILENLTLNSQLNDDLFYVSAELMKFYNKMNK